MPHEYIYTLIAKYKKQILSQMHYGQYIRQLIQNGTFLNLHDIDILLTLGSKGLKNYLHSTEQQNFSVKGNLDMSVIIRYPCTIVHLAQLLIYPYCSVMRDE